MSNAVLLLARQKGKIAKIAPYVDALRDSSIHYGEDLLSMVMQLAGEGPSTDK